MSTEPPFETAELRRSLKQFIANEWECPLCGVRKQIGSFKYGVYAFFDYDLEPIYVGQTKEKLSTRIRRHLTNQRTDAVAMNVLDPFEVFEIEVWPLATLEEEGADSAKVESHLNTLEYMIFQEALRASRFNAVLNEKPPPSPEIAGMAIPASFRDRLVGDSVKKLREHRDIRIGRRAHTLARLAQVISERKVQPGLRQTLLVQARRLEWLARERLREFAGSAEGLGRESDT